MLRAVLRLALFLLCFGLVLSRVGLVLHEVVGHGGLATLLGGELREVSLFWFGGGWVRTVTPPGEGRLVAVQLGGIGVELGTAGLLALAAHRARAPLGKALAALAGYVLAAHALWYAATGIWHGFGDGARLHQLLGPARPAVALGAAALLCGLAVLGTRAVIRTLAPVLEGPWRRRVMATLGAAALAGAAHAALAFGEVAVRHDETYRLTMRSAAQRSHEERLAALRAELERGGVLTVRLEALRAPPPRPFPFSAALAIAALASALAGAWSLRRAAPAGAGALELSPRLLRQAALAAAAAVAAVAAWTLW